MQTLAIYFSSWIAATILRCRMRKKSKSKSANKLLAELQELIIVYQKNLFYTQELLKKAYNRVIKPQSYAFSNKIWLNSKYINTKHN